MSVLKKINDFINWRRSSTPDLYKNIYFQRSLLSHRINTIIPFEIPLITIFSEIVLANLHRRFFTSPLDSSSVLHKLCATLLKVKQYWFFMIFPSTELKVIT